MIPIDEQIRLLTQAIDYPSPSSADPDSEPICIVCPDDAKAILASLQRLKAIDAVQVQMPEEPKRYDCESTGWDRTDFDMVESPDGRYIEFADYDTLRDLLKQCKHNSSVTMDELGEMRERAEAAEAKLAAINAVQVPEEPESVQYLRECVVARTRGESTLQYIDTLRDLLKKESARADAEKVVEPPKEIDPNKWAFDRKLESY